MDRNSGCYIEIYVGYDEYSINNYIDGLTTSLNETYDKVVLADFFRHKKHPRIRKLKRKGVVTFAPEYPLVDFDANPSGDDLKERKIVDSNILNNLANIDCSCLILNGITDSIQWNTNSKEDLDYIISTYKGVNLIIAGTKDPEWLYDRANSIIKIPYCRQ